MTNSFTNIAKIARVRKCNKIQGLEIEEIKESPEMCVNIAKITHFSCYLKHPLQISQKSQE